MLRTAAASLCIPTDVGFHSDDDLLTFVSQNLIPLFLRPLRLFLTSQQVRSARIVVLRVTHFPYAVAIFLYEAGYQFLSTNQPSARSTWASTMGRPESLASLKRHTLKSSLNSPKPLSAATLVQASLDGNAHAGRRITQPNSEQNAAGDVFESSHDIKSLVLRLSSQVEQLTAAVAEQTKLEQPQVAEDDAQ